MSKIISLQANRQIITPLNSNKKRILIVDDEPDITLTFKIALEVLDYMKYISSMNL